MVGEEEKKRSQDVFLPRVHQWNDESYKMVDNIAYTATITSQSNYFAYIFGMKIMMHLGIEFQYRENILDNNCHLNSKNKFHQLKQREKNQPWNFFLQQKNN